ncbi:MAG: YkgJ family cysteine cluster protein [Myxococcaceae bacterium]
MHLRPGLGVEEAARICQLECKAQCCRGALFIELSAAEVATFRASAARLGVEANVRVAADGSGEVRFLDHDGDHCPMLDDATSTCRAYDDRPQTCRDFPRGVRPGCAISGAAD